jgi:hypothetical protein
MSIAHQSFKNIPKNIIFCLTSIRSPSLFLYKETFPSPALQQGENTASAQVHETIPLESYHNIIYKKALIETK